MATTTSQDEVDKSASATPAVAAAGAASSPYPRAAVSVAIRCAVQLPEATTAKTAATTTTTTVVPHYLLILRGNEPNVGKWSFPGGKMELGETALEGARRELAEETVFDWGSIGMDNMDDDDDDDKPSWSLAWYEGGAYTTADSILWADNEEGDNKTNKKELFPLFHFLIAICFAQVQRHDTGSAKDSESNQKSLCHPPHVTPADDAADAKWFTSDEIDRMDVDNLTTPGLSKKVQCAEFLYQQGVLSNTP